jgi:hypothetical protein
LFLWHGRGSTFRRCSPCPCRPPRRQHAAAWSGARLMTCTPSCGPSYCAQPALRPQIMKCNPLTSIFIFAVHLWCYVFV